MTVTIFCYLRPDHYSIEIDKNNDFRNGLSNECKNHLSEISLLDFKILEDGARFPDLLYIQLAIPHDCQDNVSAQGPELAIIP